MCSAFCLGRANRERIAHSRASSELHPARCSEVPCCSFNLSQSPERSGQLSFRSGRRFMAVMQRARSSLVPPRADKPHRLIPAPPQANRATSQQTRNFASVFSKRAASRGGMRLRQLCVQSGARRSSDYKERPPCSALCDPALLFLSEMEVVLPVPIALRISHCIIDGSTRSS
jgi:hypothetical protein